MSGDLYARCVKRSVSITAAQDDRLLLEVREGRAANFSEALRQLLADGERYRRDRAESARRETSMLREIRQLRTRLERRPE